MKKKYLVLSILVLCTVWQLKSQNLLIKKLYFFEGGPTVLCGNIITPTLLYFVTDTLHPKETVYVIAVICPETYGKDFFKKDNKYRLYLKKYDKAMISVMPNHIYKQFLKIKNHFFCVRIDSLKHSEPKLPGGGDNDLYGGFFIFASDHTAYNAMDAGNWLWGHAMNRLGFSYSTAEFASEANEWFHDSPGDQRAIRDGFHHLVETKIIIPFKLTNGLSSNPK